MLTDQEKHVVFGIELCVPDGYSIMQVQFNNDDDFRGY